VTFRTRVFAAAFLTAAVTLLVALALLSFEVRRNVAARIERGLVNEARLAAETLSNRRAATPAELDAEADAIGRLVSARVTFVGPDGEVVGDSELGAAELQALENHANRPEIQQAHREGIGIARRYSTTLDLDMLYVAVPVSNPDAPRLTAVRLALPLTEVRDQLGTVRRIGLVAAAAGFATALLLAVGVSIVLSRRLRAIAAAAERYAAGDLSIPAREAGDDEIGMVARVLDRSVQEMKRRSDDLAADRARMEAILSGMSEGVLVLDQQGRLQLANDAARRLLRWHDAAEGKHYVELVRHPEIASQIGAALQGSTGSGLELPLDPEVIIVARSAPITSRTTRGAVVVLHDITDLRRADRIRRDFVANVSHELRTPLTAVRGYVEALLDDGADPDDTRRFLQVIARHAQRMERLVQDLLRLARLDAGQETVERVPCVLDALFTAVEADLAPAIEARRQIVERQVAPDAQAVSGDPAKLHDALRNLLENAVNYAPEDSRIVMASHRQGSRIVITVSDDGPGIPEADLPRVFERFYRVDKSRARATRDPGGTGLGLAIVKHLVELHGGKARASNRPGGGAIFAIELNA
jgi:two-component system, OmpR family, phosphate regulon sensor histidine kinase PhoR